MESAVHPVKPPAKPGLLNRIFRNAFRILFLTLLMTGLGMAIGLFTGILISIVLLATHHHVTVLNVVLMIAPKAAIALGACTLIWQIIKTTREGLR